MYKAPNFTDPTNSPSTPLQASETYTGNWRNVSKHSGLSVAIIADQKCELQIQFSSDATIADSTLSYQIEAALNEVHRVTISRRFFRIKIINGPIAQTMLRAQTQVGIREPLSSPLNSPIQADADATVTRVIETELAIVQGLFQGYSIVNKFGSNSDIDTATLPEDLWEGGGVYMGFPTGSAEIVQVFSSSANDSAAGSGARTIQITGLDSDWNTLQAVVTLNGTTPVDTPLPFRRITSGSVLTSGSPTAFNAGVITVRHKVTVANVFLSIPAGRNTAYNAGYTVPADHTAYLRKVHITFRGGAAAQLSGAIWIRQFERAPRLRRPFYVTIDSPLQDNIYGGITLPEKTDVILRITEASANNLDVTGGYDMILKEN